MSVHQDVLIRLGKLFDLRDFVETGTLAGYTFCAVQEYFDRAFTIDLHEPRPELRAKFAQSDRVFLFKGSSGDRLGEILNTHKIVRALFLLDAHGQETFFVNDGNNQIPKELEAINQYAPSSLIVVDDITWEKAKPQEETKRWVNTSYEFIAPKDWEVKYVGRMAILHRGHYVLPEDI